MRPGADGRVLVSAHHTHYTPSRADDEHVLEWVRCDSYEAAEELVGDKARRRGFRPDQIEWDPQDMPD